MPMPHFCSKQFARFLACLTILGPFADSLRSEESTDAGQSQTQSSTAKTDVRVETSKEKSSKLGGDQEQVTIVVDVSGSQPEVVEAAIDKLEKQLKSSGLPEDIQRKTLEALRSKNHQPSQGKNKVEVAESDELKAESSANNAQEPSEKTDHKNAHNQSENIRRHFQLQFPANRSFSFGDPSASFLGLGPAQKKKLREAIGEALEQSDVAEAAIDKALKSVDEAFKKMELRSGVSTPRLKPPFRIGIACEEKAADDTKPGLVVNSVFEDSPAAKAGILAGDRLTRIDDKPIQALDDILSAVQEAGEQDRSVTLEIMRGDTTSVHSIKPNQTAFADLGVELNQQSMQYPMQAWLQSPQMQFEWSRGQPMDPAVQKQVQEMREKAMQSAQKVESESQKATSRAFRDRGSDKSQDRMEDATELRGEIKELREELDEIKSMLKKLGEKS